MSRCQKYMNDKGYMVHDIEYHSSQYIANWEWTLLYSDKLWRIMAGTRPYFLNLDYAILTMNV
jgi:hypothetical protein